MHPFGLECRVEQAKKLEKQMDIMPARFQVQHSTIPIAQSSFY
ncbi:MAG: hypothetical protein ACTSYS_09670 [Promethearchaeota archaeon]